MKCSKTGVQKILRKYANIESVEHQKGTEGPKKLKEIEYNYLRFSSLQNRTKSSTQLAEDRYSSTVRRHLIRHSLRRRIVRKKQRLQYVKIYT